MTENWTAVYLPCLPDREESRNKSDFETEEKAWDWIKEHWACDKCKDMAETEDPACLSEWLVIRTEDYEKCDDFKDLLIAAGGKLVWSNPEEDSWKKQATRAWESGTCPICFGDDEGGHRDGCYVLELEDKVESMEKDIDRYKRWVDDLQSGMYINCVYCGHQYGPKETTPVSMAEVLKQHIEICPKHPMSCLKRRIEELEAKNAK